MENFAQWQSQRSEKKGAQTGLKAAGDGVLSFVNRLANDALETGLLQRLTPHAAGLDGHGVPIAKLILKKYL